jgi:ligand-binding sensor domain-containing protein
MLPHCRQQLLNLRDLIATALVRIVFLLSLLMGGCLSAVAQQARQYAFNRFSIVNGLASNQVASITQDKDGFIWLATLNGLQRYDGNSFITFKHQQNKPQTIPSNNLPVAYADQQNNIWLVGEENQVGYFNTSTFKFQEVPLYPNEQRELFTPQYFFESLEGKLMLHYKGGKLYSYNEQLKQFRPAEDLIPFPSNWKIHSIAVDKVAKCYWLCGDSGIVMYNPKTKLLNYRGHNPGNNSTINAFADARFTYNIQTLGNGYIVFCSWQPGDKDGYVHKYDPRTKQKQVYNLCKEIGQYYIETFGFLPQRKGRIWAYGMPFLAEWTQQSVPFFSVPMENKNEQSIRCDNVFSAFEDRDENIWLATDNGAFFFNPDEQVFTSYSLIRPGEATPTEASVNALLETEEGNILVGCWAKGLYNFDKQFRPIDLPGSLKPYSTLSVWDMTQHSKTKQVWVTLESGEIILYDPKNDKSTLIAPPIFDGRPIRQVTEDQHGNLWFGTQGGKIIKWDFQRAQSDPTRGYVLVRKAGVVNKLHADNEGAMWVSTIGSGVLKLDAASNRLLKVFSKEGKAGERLLSNTSTDMTQYNDTVLIIAAGGINIMNTRTNKVRYISSENGLPSDFMMSVQCDQRGTVWAGSQDGLSRVNIERKIVTNYNRSDGIVYDKFATAGVEELTDGRVIFYTDHNFLVLDPNKFVQSNVPPRPFITAFHLAGAPLSIDSLSRSGEATLNYNNTSITIAFSTLSFNRQQKLHYYYMLEGVDQNWIHTDQFTRATYNSLPPGNHVFRVRSENADGVVSEEIASIPIIVRPPFWRTWWFFGAIVLVVISILFVIDKERMNRLRSMQNIRSQIAGNLHHEINTTLNNINVLSEMAKIKAEKDVVRSKEYIQQISERSHNMIIMMDDILWSIDPKNDTMEETLLRLKEFVEALQHRNNALISLAVDNKVLALELEMKARHELFLVMKLALRMIVEDAYGTSTQINLDKVKSNLIFKLNDTSTRNIVHKAAFQAKLQELESRAAHINAEVDVQSDSKGISIIVIVPV